MDAGLPLAQTDVAGRGDRLSFGKHGAALVALGLLMTGCLSPASYGPAVPVAQPGMDPAQLYPGVAFQPNPVFVPVQDPNLLWDQLVDVVDDYFEIAREDRVQPTEGIEGRIVTFPRGASTIFEPWNRDSVTPYERWEATLQSTRRIGELRVIPAEGGFLIEVSVLKELEDVAKPDAVFIGNESLRNDTSIRRFNNNLKSGGESLGWIPKGRDVALEQEIILQLQSRFAVPMAPQVPVYLSENPPARPLPAADWRPGGEDGTKSR